MQGISALAIPWYVVKDLGLSSTWGIIYLLVTAIVLFWGIYAGSLIDRYSRKVILISNPFFCGILLIILSFLFEHGMSNLMLCSFCFLCIFLSYSLHFPNLYAVCQEMASKNSYGKMNSILEIQGQFSLIVAGSIAAFLMHGAPDGIWPILGTKLNIGIVFKSWPISKIIFCNGIGLCMSALMVFWIRYEVVNNRTIEEGSVLKRIKSGFRFLFFNPYLFIFGICSFTIFFVVIIVNFMISPQYIANHLNGGADVYGISEVYFGIGSALAGALAFHLFGRFHAIYGVSILLMIAALCLIGFYLNTSIPMYYFGFVFLGFSNAGARVLRMTYLLKSIPNEVVGRANSVFNVINSLGRLIFIGLFSLPFFAFSNNVIYTMAILGFVLIISLLVCWNYREKIIYWQLNNQWIESDV